MKTIIEISSINAAVKLLTWDDIKNTPGVYDCLQNKNWQVVITQKAKDNPCYRFFVCSEPDGKEIQPINEWAWVNRDFVLSDKKITFIFSN